jgi:general secretion pathway protein G
MKTLQHKTNAAFTLLEIMLVVMIIAILAGSAIYLMRGQVDQAAIVRAEGDIQLIKTNLGFYAVRNGTAPTTAQGLNALVTRPSGEPQPRKWSQLLPEVPLDPWGQPYHLRNPATMSKDGYDVFSSGPDRQPGTADDIGNW